MEDAQFKQFAQLLHDREFRALRRLTLSKLSFPSRFMRDWARAFVLDRFQSLEYLDIIGKCSYCYGITGRPAANSLTL
jgi:hypothetical protein